MEFQDLITAISERNLQEVDEYIRRGGSVSFLHERMSPLVYALSSCVYSWENSTFDAIILRLLENGCLVDATHPPSGMTATMLAMKCRRREQIIIKFIKSGTDVDMTCGDGKTELIHAIENGYGKTVIRELLNEGADADYRWEGYTPLYCAVCIHNDPDVIEMLLNEGANIHAGDENDNPLLSLCCKDACKLDDICRHKRVTDILITKGARLKGTFCHGNTMLHLAICNYVISLALEKGEEIETKNFDGMTPLLYSLIYKQADKVNDLLLFGANPNCKDTKGCTPLHYFRVIRYKQLIDLLIFHGANFLAENDNKMTPLDLIFSDELIYDDRNLQWGIKTLMKHYLLYVDETGLSEYVRRINKASFIRFISRCKIELGKMRNSFLTEDLSFYDFCRSKKFYRTAFIPIGVDEYKYEHKNISATFPLFKYVILMRLQDNSRKQFKNDFIKNYLVKLKVRAPVIVGIEHSIELDPRCLYRTCEYLTFKQLYVLLLASLKI